MPWQVPGVSPHRTWICAPLASTLAERWAKLVSAPASEKPGLFGERDSAGVMKKKPGLFGFTHDDRTVADEQGQPFDPIAIGYRSFDTQYIIPDDRLMDRPRPDPWRVQSSHQIHIAEQHDQVIQSGPGLTFTAAIPDLHYYAGRGGRVLPLYASTDTSTPNLAPGLADALGERMGVVITAEDFLAYVAAITAHPAFTTRFVEDLRTPGIRLPITANASLWNQGVALGRRVLWLHARGERYVDSEDGRPSGPPGIADTVRRPLVIVAIPDTADRYPDELSYDSETRALYIGEGKISPVDQAVADYEVSGMNVLRKWFGYRRATRPQARGEQSALDDIRPEVWPSAYTSDLLELIRVLTLVVDLEPVQTELLNRVMDSERVTVADLTELGVFPVPDEARSP